MVSVVALADEVVVIEVVVVSAQEAAVTEAVADLVEGVAATEVVVASVEEVCDFILREEHWAKTNWFTGGGDRGRGGFGGRGASRGAPRGRGGDRGRGGKPGIRGGAKVIIVCLHRFPVLRTIEEDKRKAGRIQEHLKDSTNLNCNRNRIVTLVSLSLVAARKISSSPRT